MSYFVRLPQNPSVDTGHRAYLNVLERYGTVIQKELRRDGLSCYEPITQAAVLALCGLQPSIVFYDIGAHIGLYSALVAEIYHKRRPKVVAFEPAPGTAETCRQIAARNRLAIEVVECAVCSVEGDAALFLSLRAETSNSLNPGFRPGSPQITVRAITIDGYVAAGGTPPTIMKIDVETFEADVLEGAIGVIACHRPPIIVEVLRDTNGDRFGRLLGQLEKAGYRFYHLAGDMPWRAQPASRVLEYASDQERDWLFSPSELSASFYREFNGWRVAIAKCDKSTNRARLFVRGARDWIESLVTRAAVRG